MKLSTKVRYGLRAMIYLALQGQKDPVFTSTIAKELDVSRKYLESLLIALKNAELLRSIRGYKGGYMLSRPAEDITIHDIYHALEGPVAIIDCVNEKNHCTQSSICTAREFWGRVMLSISQVLTNTTLDMLASIESDKKKSEFIYSI